MSRQMARVLVTPRQWLAVALVGLGFLLSGCPDEGVVCGEGLTRCGLDCVDLTAESNNCGACGVACGQAQVCADSVCSCREGSTECGGQCVVLTSDARHCGACNNACGPSQVCEAGACKTSCALGATQCGSSCPDLQTDPLNCGACGVVCADGRACRAGVCRHDVVAACFNTGQVVGLQGGAQDAVTKGPNAQVGANPLTVARMQDVLLALDSTPMLRQASLFNYAVLAEEDAVGGSPNQVLVSDPYVYVLNSSDNNLVTFQRKANAGPLTNGTRFPGGLDLQPVAGASVLFGANTNPFAMVKVGNELFVSLYGNLLGDPSQGGKVARVSLADPAKPTLVGQPLQLPTGAELQPFQGSNPIPGPAGVTAANGRVYVTLNNIDPATYAPGGPGLLAKLNPTTFTVEKLIHLGEGCLNPGWAAPVGTQVVVSCSGKSTYDAIFNVVAVEKTGLVLVGADDTVLATAPLACPAGATGCELPSAGRFAVVGSRVYLADQNAGRVFVYEVANNTFREVRGLGNGSSILACPREKGPSLVGDVVATE